MQNRSGYQGFLGRTIATQCLALHKFHWNVEAASFSGSAITMQQDFIPISSSSVLIHRILL